MNILLLGGGGREHAIAWKLKQSPLCEHLFILPGNAGTPQCGVNLPFSVTDFESIKKVCLELDMDMVIPGPEDPLVKGIADFFRNDPELKHIPVIGPGKSGAQLEGSKAFAKQFMMRHHIPTAGYREFTKDNFEEGKNYLQQHELPVVLKADGLAAGKGVVICQSHEEAVREFEQMIKDRKFGEAGTKVVVEQFLEGIELSVFVLTDGKHYLLLPEAKDYKKIGEGDTGPNTGGMGAVSPVPFADKMFMQKVKEQIIEPTVLGIQKDELDYIGFIFFGLISVQGEPYVIEYNCRLGDPETEAIMPRIKNDLVELLNATAHGSLDTQELDTDSRCSGTIILVSGGYPGAYQKGKLIRGIKKQVPDASFIFHAGTSENDRKIFTDGGRVIAITSLAGDLKNALKMSAQMAEEIQFDGKYFRKDIGFEFL
ncbi:MAG: phosphoribosylamine--glycine ligase [Chitinophagaceae bacterium]|nr:MAG: phosphoribosylamine--glycine ligase [Chitinophagaceae bacterium]